MQIKQRYLYDNKSQTKFIAEIISVTPFKCVIVQSFCYYYTVGQYYEFWDLTKIHWSLLEGQNAP